MQHHANVNAAEAATALLTIASKATKNPERIAEAIAYLEPTPAGTRVSVLLGGRAKPAFTLSAAEGDVTAILAGADIVRKPTYALAAPLLQSVKAGEAPAILPVSARHWELMAEDATATIPAEAQCLTFPAEALRLAIPRIAHAMAVNDIRWYLNGANFQANGTGTAYLVATDGHRLAEHTLELVAEHSNTTGDNVVVPRSAMLVLRKLLGRRRLPADAVVTLRHYPDTEPRADGYATFELPSVTLRVVLPDARYPDWKHVVRDQDDERMFAPMTITDPSAFAETVRALDERTTKPRHGDKHILLQTGGWRAPAAPANAGATPPLCAEAEGDPAPTALPIRAPAGLRVKPGTIGVNPQYLSDALDALGGPDATLRLPKGRGQSVVPSDALQFHRAGLTCVVMPVRL